MKIAQIAPPWLKVPPRCYGGIETVIYDLTEELVAKGHDVTLFAPGGSRTSAKLIAPLPEPLGNIKAAKDNVINPLIYFERVFSRAGEFDLVHNHDEYYSMFFASLVKTSVVQTLHNSYERKYLTSEQMTIFKEFKSQNYVTISKSQKKFTPKINISGTVYNGINLDHFKYKDKPGDYLFWIGRTNRKKGGKEAISIAKRLGVKLIMAGSIDVDELWYYEKEIKPYVDGKQIVFIPEVDYDEKVALFQNALCTISPIHWEEPFGLIMVESMACGTPVVAFDRGAAKEVILDGFSGLVVSPKKSTAGMVSAVKNISQIRRENCRKWVEDNFSSKKMANDYEDIYRKILGLPSKASPRTFRYSH